MKLTLGPDAEQIIQEQLRNRKFADAEAVVLAGLKSLSAAAPDEFDAGEMQALLAEGEESLNVGMGLELLVEILTFVHREGRPEGSGVARRGRKILCAKFCCT